MAVFVLRNITVIVIYIIHLTIRVCVVFVVEHLHKTYDNKVYAT